MSDEGLGRFALLASAIAGRPVDVAAGDPGQPAWTDGATVFVPADAIWADQVCAIAVQASLLGAGSLEPEVFAELPRCRSAAVRRYLAIEGHRALAEHEALLPLSARALIDRAMAARSESPAASLEVAASREEIDDSPTVFGTIRPKDLRRTEHLAETQIAQRIPRRDRDEVLRELDDGEDDEHEPLVFDASSPVGGGGALGRLLKRPWSDSRTSTGGGPPGADSPTHMSKRSTGGGRIVAVSAARAVMTGDPGVVRGSEAVYPEWDVFHSSYRPKWCTVVEVEP